MSVADVNGRLMRAMGSPQGFWDPIPPDQYMCFLDAETQLSQRAQRALAWMRWKTLRAKRGGRTAYAKDDRGELGLGQLASDLGWTKQNASDPWQELEMHGLARRDGRRLLLCAKVEKQVGERKSEDGEEVFCTEYLPKALLAFFQSLPKNRRAQCLQSFSRVQEFRKRLEAEAIQAARETGQEIEDRFLSALGYEHQEPRGAPKKKDRPPAAIQLSILEVPDFSVQNTEPEDEANSVQAQNGIPHTNGNGHVQKPASLLSTERQSRVSEYAPEPPAPGTAEPPPPAEPTHSKPIPKKAKSEEESAQVIATIETLAGQEIGKQDPLRGDVAALVRTHGAAEVEQYLHAKAREKSGKRYRITTAAALVQWAKEDLPLRQNRARIAPQPAAEPEPPAATIARLEGLLAEHPGHQQAAEWRAALDTLRKQARRSAHAGGSQP